MTNGILQGIDKIRLPVIHAAVSLGLHVILLYVLIAVFKLEGMAIVWAYIFFGVIMCVLNNLAIRKHLRYRQEVRRTFLIPLAASIAMSVVSKLLYNILFTIMGETKVAMLLCLAIAVIVAVIVYFIVLLALRGLREKELLAFPKGTMLVKVAKKLHFRL